jgi:hypothetical protein
LKAALITVVTATTIVLTSSPAYSNETPPEVTECFAEHADKNPVRLGAETQESDFVCLAHAELVPNPRVAGHYAWWTPEPRTPTAATLAAGRPTLVPVDWTGAILPTPEPEPELTPEPVIILPPETVVEPSQPATPTDVEVEPIVASFARAATTRVKVTYSRVAGADRYTVKCGQRKTGTTKAKAKLKARKGAACKVRARGNGEVSPWSKAVRVR